jgi:hypothetical protein
MRTLWSLVAAAVFAAPALGAAAPGAASYDVDIVSPSDQIFNHSGDLSCAPPWSRISWFNDTPWQGSRGLHER